jgi:hypothetical protein
MATPNILQPGATMLPDAQTPVAQGGTMQPQVAQASQPINPGNSAPAEPQAATGGGIQVPAGLDPTAFFLTKAIKQAETAGDPNAYNAQGDNGTSSGAYQIQQSNWGPWAQQYLGDANAPQTEENQNKLAYSRVADLLKQGYKPSQVASIWNSGKADSTGNVGVNMINGKPVAYDTPGYVSKVQQAYQQIQQQFAQPVNAQTQGAPSQTPGGPSVGGFVENIGSSAVNLAEGLGNMVMHPIDTASNILGTAAGGVEKLFGADANNPDVQKFNNLVTYAKNRYGGDSLSQIIGNIGHTLYTDPVGAALDLSTLVDGLGGALGAASKISKVSELGDAANALHTASEAINPISQGAALAGKVVAPVVSKAGDVLQSAASHATGLEPATLQSIFSNPSAFSKTAMDETSRGGVLQDVQDGLQNLENQYSETGKMYKGIQSTEGTVKLPENFMQDILSKGTLSEDGSAIKYGLNMDAKGNITADTKSFTRDPGDIKAIQQFTKTWGNKTELTPQEFLNMRKDATGMAKYGKDLGTNKGAQLLGRSIRAELNKAGRPQVPGLATADKMTEEQLPVIQKVTKDIYNKDGDLKDNAASKVANALNKSGMMDRLEKVSPGITQKLNVLRAVEDIEKSSGIKVGNYGRTMFEGGAALTGNVPAIISAIITHPKIATQILRGAGYTTKAAIMPILAKVRGYLGVLPKDTFKVATKLGVEANKAQSTQ